MTVAHDASTETTFTTTDPATFDHTPSGTPRGVIVAIAHSGTTDLIDSTVSYGGVSMTRIGVANDVATEAGRVYLYFLGASIPTGTQTVSINHTGAATTKWAVAHTLTASGDTCITNVNIANGPNRAGLTTLMTSYLSALRVGVMYNGVDTDATTIGGDMSNVQTHDFGAFVARYDRETTASTGEMTWAWTAAADDWASVIAAVAEVPGSSTSFAIDALTEFEEVPATPDPFTFSHTPVNTPRGVLVFLYSKPGSGSTDWANGVTYGGTSMTEIVTASDTATEAARAYAFFLGSSIPTGMQTVSVDHDGSADTKGAMVVTLTGNSDLAVTASASDSENQANPQAALDSGADQGKRFSFIASGLAATSSLTQVYTTDRLATFEGVALCAALDTEPTTSTGNQTVGFTSGADDVAAVYVLVEQTAAPVLDEYGFASETDTAMPFLAGTIQTLEYGFASETDAAMPFLAASNQTVEFAFASETDAAMPFSADTQIIDDFGFASETDEAMPFSADTQIIDEFGFASETDSAMPFEAVANEDVAFDASTDLGTATTGALTGTHTPVGTPAGVVVKIVHGTETTDLITGVTYGGQAMDRVGYAIDDAGEPGRAYLYFLGSGIPTGAQTVTVSHTGTATVKWANVESYTAGEDTTIAATWQNNNMGLVDDLYSASIYTQQTALRTGVVYTGHANVGDVTLLSGMSAVNSVDFGNFIGRADRETTASAGKFDYGYTSGTTDDFAAFTAALVGVSTVPTTALGLVSTHVFTWTTITDPDFGIYTGADTGGAIMFVGMYGTPSATDFFTSADYGGTAFTEYGHATDTAGEAGHSYGLYVSGISGSDTISMVATSVTNPQVAVVFCIASPINLIDSGTDSENQADPSDALDSGSADAIRFGFIFSGLGTAASLTPSNLPDEVLTLDGVNATSTRLDADLTLTAGNITVGWTAVSDDVAAVYGAFSEGDVLDTFGFASETDTAMPFLAASNQTVEFAFASESDTAMPFTADTQIVDEFGFASETDTAMPFEASLDLVDEFGFASETDSAMPFTAVTNVLDEFGFASETDTAMPFAAAAEEESPGEISSAFFVYRPLPIQAEWTVWHASRFGELREQIPWVSFSGSPFRIIDNVSSITVTGRDDPSVLRRIKPWASEIQIRRGGAIMWAGPVTEVSYEFNADTAAPVTIVASDLLHWLSARLLRRPIEPDRVSTQFQEIIRRAMQGDNVGLEPAIPQPVGINGDELATEITDALSEILGLAPYLDFTMFGRELLVGKEEVPFGNLPNLILPDHAASFTVTHEGAEEASQVFVRGGDEFVRGEDDDESRARIVNRYPSNVEREDPDIGLVQRLVSDSDIVTDFLAARTAQSAYMYSQPPLYVMSVTLGPRSPFIVDNIIAGSEVQVSYPDLAIYSERMRVRSIDLDVTAEDGDTTTLELIPRGVFTGHFVASVL